MSVPQTNASLLIELGCEELPPKALDSLRQAWFDAVCEGLERDMLPFDRVASQAWSAPRRLALLLAGVASKQPDQDLERKGPAVQAAFDASGQPTPAAEGFARSVGIPVADLERLKTDQGEWLVARQHKPGESLDALLYPILEAALRKLPVPRPMRWADHDFAFVRPVHWLLVLHGDRVVPGQLLGQQAGRETHGHRIHAPGPHRIEQAEDYLHVLREASVLADQQERRQAIAHAVTSLEPAARIEDALLDEVNNLVEWPVAVSCSFDEEFLNIPHQALVASMQDHQKFFPVLERPGGGNQGADSGGVAISNRFVAVSNLQSADVAQVRAGYERVIRPRLADARFFLEQDQKHSLSAYFELLETVVYQEKIGTLADKSRRIAAISKEITDYLGIESDPAQRAAHLSKCDLMTQMVGEFPELQGVMGEFYARSSGEPDEVAGAISGHYLPRFAGDRTPPSETGQVVAIADRADTLVGIFAAGMKPSGNKDPFALRRAALALVRILLDAKLPLAPHQVLTWAAEQLEQQGVVAPAELVSEVDSFVLERARSHFREAGFGPELIQAVLSSEWRNLPDAEARLEALAAFMQLEDATALAAANKRIGNILKKSEARLDGKIDENRLILAEEKQLYRAISDLGPSLSEALDASNYQQCLRLLATLRNPVDQFFDGVMVMDEDESLRENRLHLLYDLKRRFDRVADLSVLG